MNLIEKIDRAFSGCPHPRLMLITEQMASHEVGDVSAMLKRSWNEINGEELERHFEFMNWLSPEAFCYFLPAVLKVSVKENNPDLMAVHALINFLDCSDDPNLWSEFFVKRFSLLSQAECGVLQEWILWLSSLDNTTVNQHALGRALSVLEVIKQKARAGV